MNITQILAPYALLRSDGALCVSFFDEVTEPVELAKELTEVYKGFSYEVIRIKGVDFEVIKT